MPSWGTVTLVEAVWVLAFAAALGASVAAARVFLEVRGRPPVSGVPETAQGAIADYFVLLTRLLVVKSSAGLLLGLYAAFLPAAPAPPPAWLARAGNAPGAVLLSVLAGAVVWTALATWRVYRAIAAAVPEDLPENLVIVERRPGGRRNYDKEAPT